MSMGPLDTDWSRGSSPNQWHLGGVRKRALRSVKETTVDHGSKWRTLAPLLSVIVAMMMDWARSRCSGDWGCGRLGE